MRGWKTKNLPGTTHCSFSCFRIDRRLMLSVKNLTVTWCTTGQEMVRENKNSSRSGKCQGSLFWVREN